MPAGGEHAARGFYCDLLGMIEEPKPAELAARGGCWFRSDGVRLHLGVDADFRPAKKAHPALRVSEFGALVAGLRQAGCTVREDGPFEGSARIYVDDPFGNRIELIAEEVP
ncbi:glyoxalase [Novosphingobium sp. Gsoil 351]|nr:glyoxalase [Novosphingobium sp. Gsoil 351]